MHSKWCKNIVKSILNSAINKITMRKNTFNKQKIDASKYVNTDTGETLGSEIGNITSVNKANPDYIKLKSEAFYIIDDKAVNYLREKLSKMDMYYLYAMCQMVYGQYNILHNKEIKAHTKETLRIDLTLARNAFNRLLGKLLKQGVIYYIDGYKNGKKTKQIMLNPNLARRTNVLHRSCINSFQCFD